MPNNAIFSDSFHFHLYKFTKYKYTDNRSGVILNYLAYMAKGSAKLNTVENETVNISEGDIFFIPNGCKYRSYWYGSPEIEFISLGFVFMPNFDNKHYTPQVIKKDSDAITLMKDIISQPTLDGKLIGKFYTLVGMLIPNMVYRTQNKQLEIIEKAKHLIAVDPTLKVREIARMCAVSESALYSSFKKYSEQSINELKTGVMMKKAEALVVSTDHPIEEISRRLGFSSSSYFRKCFKDHFGMSPREMRKKSGM